MYDLKHLRPLFNTKYFTVYMLGQITETTAKAVLVDEKEDQYNGVINFKNKKILKVLGKVK